ncbi:MAG TPA: ABC transporter ATP-binding protein [Myxococcota bacterium]|nr:ABC transporter ATP-binding protein [Myxococcota bacterium]
MTGIPSAAAAAAPALALDAVALRYGPRDVLAGLTLSVGAGEVLALLGPSGSGKSTVVRLVLGLAAPDAGEVRVGGALVSSAGRVVVPPEERGLGVVFQDLALWPHLTVRGNLAFGLSARGVPRHDRHRRIDAMLARVGLSDRAACRPGELSGGERQRVAIARALVLEPRAVLLDEPLSSLDVLLRRELVIVFRALLHERGIPALYVTHEPREAAALGDRIAVLEAGRVVQEGTLDALRARPASPFVEQLLADLTPPGPAPPGPAPPGPAHG